MKCSRPNCGGILAQHDLCRKHYDAWIAENPTVPADVVAEHIRQLRAAGMNGVHIAELAGVSHGAIYRISSGRRTFVQGPIAQKILAVRATNLFERPAGWVPIIGVARRLQALVVLGYTTLELADRTGYGVQCMPDLIRAQQPWVSTATARAVDRVYRELMFTPAPDTLAAKRARMRAQRAGWAPALAWDDDTIDDPNAQPDLGRTVETGEIVVDLRAEGLPDQRIAEVLGIKLDSVQQSARRYERKIAS